MTHHWMKTGGTLALLLAVAGCNQTVSSPGSLAGNSPAPLRAAPTPQVYSNQLPPPPPPPVAAPAVAQAPPATPGLNSDGTPATPPVQAASAAPVTREGLVGAWRVSSGGGNCQIFMALTQWTGGYRAASRGCPGQVADVSAWDVSGSQVVLKDSGGSTVATLNSAGGTRYEGSTTGGQPVSLYR